ncbi:flagellin [Poseidonibacter lekithochrous]|uniref:flagellin n=2 Tax=Poseidonibacter lekithochrous TaxID=1904463 RepID=UPI0008FC3AAD|nr:flagellin [Poseidonibacter lekithochrous]QKJ24031.1 flagellin [Poseidonibacter lekithochrous]
MRLYMGGAASIAYSNYNHNTQLFQKSLERLSSGLRINSAADDPSGLAIADKLRTQASSINQSIQNANSAIGLTQIADKAMAEQSNIIDIIKSKLIQARTATTSDEGREAIRKDIVKYLEQLDNIAEQTNYNGRTLLQKDRGDNTSSDSLQFQVGESSSDTIDMNGVQSNTTGLNLNALKTLGVGGLTANVAATNMSVVDDALSQLNTFRSEFGSTQNQLESSIRYMVTMETNLKASESAIRDVDYAKETMELNRLKIIMQAGMYAIAQANKMQEQMIKYLYG